MITETIQPSMIATATGLINAFWQLGSVIVPSGIGLVFASTGSFRAAFITLAVGPFVGLFCALAVRETAHELSRVNGNGQQVRGQQLRGTRGNGWQDVNARS